MSLMSRLSRLERSPGFGPKTFIVAAVGVFGARAAGEIRAWDNGNGASLFVPAEYSANPTEGLSDRQRGLIRGRHRVITVVRRARRAGGVR
jgi:hypothetical protein